LRTTTIGAERREIARDGVRNDITDGGSEATAKPGRLAVRVGNDNRPNGRRRNEN